MRLLLHCLLPLALSLTLAAGVAALSPGAAAQSAAPDRGVPFATLRNRTGNADPGRFYGDERSGLSAGWCDITEIVIPGMSSVAEAVPFRVPEEILRVEAIREAELGAVLDSLDVVGADRAPVLYTHGFFIDFEKGCRRATILQENAGLAGRFLWFSWPSDGALLNYTHDEADLYWSAPDLADLIVRMAERFPETRVNVAGHSLGGRGVVLALYDVASRYPDVRVGNVALLAPDIDFDVFRKLLPRILPIAQSITVYVAESDRPLALSEQVHGYPRLGQSGNDVSRLEGVEVIDLSDLQVRTPSGHLYHIYNTEVGDDLNQIFDGGKRAAERRNLVQAGENLWRLQPAE